MSQQVDQRRTRAVIVDDEELARKLVVEYLSDHSDIEVVAECANGFEAVKAAAELSPDLLFLDIQMPKLDGFEVLDLLKKDIAVIFVTAYDEYALKAFEVHAVDYLLKPFSKDRFDEALVRARERSGKNREAAKLAQIADEARHRATPIDRLLIRDGAKVHVIPVDTIDYIEAQDDYFLVRAEGKKLLRQGTLSSLEQELDPKHFPRIHRSYILNIDRLSKIELYAKDSRVAILTDGTRLQVSRAGYAKLKAMLNL
jgi:two-component system LytT family response regulator